MEYIVPQFIERETKIFGPFTFKQFIFIGIAGGISIFIFFTIKSFALFLISALILMGAAFALAFFKRGGFSLPKLIQNFFVFLTKPKIYLWKKKAIPPKMAKKEREVKEEAEEEGSALKIAEKSRLRNLYTLLETKLK
jgi:hypothetical protein